jgi:hypothetical protein
LRQGVDNHSRLYSAAGDGNEPWTRLREVAAWLRLELIELAVTSSADAARKIAGIAQPADHFGVFVVCSGLFKDVDALAAAAAKRKQPLFGCNAFQVAEQNAVLSYAPDLYFLGIPWRLGSWIAFLEALSRRTYRWRCRKNSSW